MVLTTVNYTLSNRDRWLLSSGSMVILDSSTIMARQACSALAQIFLTKELPVLVIAMINNVCLSTRQPYLTVTRPTRTRTTFCSTRQDPKQYLR